MVSTSAAVGFVLFLYSVSSNVSLNLHCILSIHMFIVKQTKVGFGFYFD